MREYSQRGEALRDPVTNYRLTVQLHPGMGPEAMWRNCRDAALPLDCLYAVVQVRSRSGRLEHPTSREALRQAGKSYGPVAGGHFNSARNPAGCFR